MRPKIQVKYDFALGKINAGQGKPTETLAGASRQQADNNDIFNNDYYYNAARKTRYYTSHPTVSTRHPL